MQDSLRFADTLPVALRALYVHDWDIGQNQCPFDDPLQLVDEVRSLRSRHNSAADTAISDVARALRRFVVVSKFDDLLNSLPAGAIRFWSG